MNEPLYPEIEVQLTGRDGNAFVILGAVASALKKNKVSKEKIDGFMEEGMSGDYDHLLPTAGKWVTVR